MENKIENEIMINFCEIGKKLGIRQAKKVETRIKKEGLTVYIEDFSKTILIGTVVLLILLFFIGFMNNK